MKEFKENVINKMIEKSQDMRIVSLRETMRSWASTTLVRRTRETSRSGSGRSRDTTSCR